MGGPVGDVNNNDFLPAGPLRADEFAERFRASFRVLWLLALAIVGDPHLAEDVVQEAGIIALGKLNQFRPGTNLTAWLGRIVRNVALNQARKHRKHRGSGLDPAALEYDDSSEPEVGRPVPSLHSARDATRAAANRSRDEELADLIMRAVHGVSDVARACLLLRTLEGMEYARIAELLNIPEGTAMSHVHRTRHYLRKQLAELGFPAPPHKDPHHP